MPKKTDNEMIVISKTDLAAAFNEWIRRSIAAPDLFTADWEIAAEFTGEKDTPNGPTYGAQATEYLLLVTRALKRSAASAAALPDIRHV